MFHKFPLKGFSIPSQTRFITQLTASYSKIEAIPLKQNEVPGSGQTSKLWNVCHFDLAKPADTNCILHFMKKNYFCTDPLSLALNLCYKKLEKTLEFYVRESLSQGMTVLAKSESDNEIMGVCINQKSCRWDAKRLAELAKASNNINSRKLLYIWALLASESAMNDRLSQLDIFDLKFISVNKSLEGQELSTELARQSLDLGRDLNYKFARIDATDDCTKKIAEKFWMKKLWDVSYKNIVTEDETTPVAKMSKLLNPFYYLLPLLYPFAIYTQGYPNAHAGVYYINLKTMPEGIENLGKADNDQIKNEKENTEREFRGKFLIKKDDKDQ